jgi:hypothetical protein
LIVAFVTEKLGNAWVRILDDQQLVGEIRDLRLQNARFRRNGRLLIGEEVPLPLYWEQYADHEHPERNCGSNGSVRVIENGGERIVLECTGSTRSGSVRSAYVVALTRGRDAATYLFDIHASLRVADEKSWQVTSNPHHGELEFCNFWPDGVFAADGTKALLYDGCYVVRGNSVHVIPHHHLESSDKHNIIMTPGDKMMWLLEDENPCIELLGTAEVAAGVCAYMWDAHLGYRICHGVTARTLHAGDRYEASFRLSSLPRSEGERIVAVASRLVSPEIESFPLVVEGVNAFDQTLANTRIPLSEAWPWETEVISGDATHVAFGLDREFGLGDRTSVRIDASTQAHAVWKATTLGPAFRQPRFASGARYRLAASVRTSMTSGAASITLRIHREGSPHLFDPQQYESYRSEREVAGGSDWTRLEVRSPVITPAPDRMHFLLEMRGTGTCWFDNVHFVRDNQL